MDAKSTCSPSIEPHYTPQELAEPWGFSARFIRELFEDEPGVLIIDRPERMHKRGVQDNTHPRFGGGQGISEADYEGPQSSVRTGRREIHGALCFTEQSMPQPQGNQGGLGGP